MFAEGLGSLVSGVAMPESRFTVAFFIERIKFLQGKSETMLKF